MSSLKAQYKKYIAEGIEKNKFLTIGSILKYDEWISQVWEPKIKNKGLSTLIKMSEEKKEIMNYFKNKGDINNLPQKIKSRIVKPLIFLLILFYTSCIKNNCTPYATCKDESLQFGRCDSVCKGIGIKYYYECTKDGTLTIKGC